MLKIRFAALLPLVIGACSSNNNAEPQVIQGGAGGGSNIGTMTTGSGTSDSSTTGSPPATTSGPPTTGGISTFDQGSGGTQGGGDDLTPCAGVSLETQSVETEVPREITTTIETEVPAPVAIYVLLDNSLSMSVGASGVGNVDPGQVNNGEPTKWEEAVQAITDFVNDPGSAGVEVGIQYFHDGNNGGFGNMATPEECDGTFHGTPAVDVGPLPDNAAAIVSSLSATNPVSDTPTVGALTGGTAFCTAFQADHPDYQCIVVMVTDGQPNGCGLSASCADGGPGGNQDCVDPLSAETLTPIASAGLAAGVTTFTVGMSGVTADGFALLDAIAVAGGSDCTPGAAGDEACDVSETGAAGLLDALNTIRDTIVVTETTTETITETVTEVVALPCQWEIPEPPGGETLDPNLVNVIVAADGVAGEPLGKVGTEAECAGGAGWYYDDNAAPTSIMVCPQTCDLVTNNGNVQVEVELGCETIVK